MPPGIRVAQFGQGEELRSWQRRIQDIMDEMRNRSFCDYRASGSWLPTVNIYSTRATYYVCVELAGIEPGSVTIECPDAQHVSIRGARVRPPVPNCDGPCSLELMEIDEGAFYRLIDFNETVEVAALEWSYDQGYLWITLRKASRA